MSDTPTTARKRACCDCRRMFTAEDDREVRCWQCARAIARAIVDSVFVEMGAEPRGAKA